MNLIKDKPRLYRLGVRFPKTVVFLSLFLTLLSLYFAKKLKIENDLIGLLPRHTESVESLNELQRYFGGQGFLMLTVESDDPSLSETFADRWAARIEALPDVRFVDYKRPVEYFKSRQWLYLDLPDLQEIERRIDRSLVLEKKGVSPTFSKMMDFADEEDRPDLTFEDIREKYEKRAGVEWNAKPTGEEGKLVVLKVKAKDYAENLDSNRKLISEIQSEAATLQQEALFKNVQLGYAGDYQRSIEDADQTTQEVAFVSLVVTALLFLVLFLYFRGFSSLFLIGLPLTAGVIWTGGLLYFIFGHLSIITAFGAAILAGLGSDYGIYLLSRYRQEREMGKDFQESCRLAFGSTGRATYASMIATVGSFVALLFSDFGVFREFGVLGGVGLVCNYAAMMVLIPSLLALKERWWGSRFKTFKIPLLSSLRLDFSHSKIYRKVFFPHGAVAGVLAVLILCLFSGFVLPTQSKIYFEDGQLASSHKKASDAVQAKVDRVFTNNTLNPTVLIVKGGAQEEKTVRTLEELLKGEAETKGLFTRVLGLSTFIPQEQDEKKAVLEKIREKFAKVHTLAKKKQESLLLSMTEALKSDPVRPENLPESIRRMFVSFLDPEAYAVFLFPSDGTTFSENIKRLHEAVKNLKQSTGLQYTAADSRFVADDTVRLIEGESARGMILLLLFLALVLLLIVQPPSRALLILFNLLASLLLLCGLLWLFKIRLNVINISMFPIILGTGIDCFIHFSHRLEEIGDMTQTVKTEMGPIFVSNLTSIIGFGGLLLTSSAGLRSVGWVAVLGLSIVTLMCAFVFPRCLQWLTLRRELPLRLESERSYPPLAKLSGPALDSAND